MHCRFLQQIGQRLFVSIVAALISADAIISILWLLPTTCSGTSLRLQQIAGVYAAANVMSNFFVSGLGSPGDIVLLLAAAMGLSFKLACLYT